MMSERRRGRAAWAVAALIALVLAACSSGDAPGASATATDVSPPAADVVATTDADAPVADMPELPAALAATGLAEPTMWVPGPNGEGASFVAPGYRASVTDPEAVAWEYLDTFTDVYGVGAPGERFEVLAVTPTAVGTIVRFDQRLGDLPLYAGGFTLTVHDSTVTAVTGMVLADAEVPAAVLDADAILAAVGGSEPGRTPDPDTLRAVAYSPLLEGVPSDAVPAWELEFDGEDWTDRERVVLSAIDGSRLAAEPLVIGAESWDIYQSSGTKFDASTATHVISVRGDEITQEDGKVTGVRCRRVATCTFDENGVPDICVQEDSEFVVPADTVIFAVGQRPELDEGFGVELGRGSRVVVTEDGGVETGTAGVFAAGDAVSGTVSVITAIAAGRKAASAIDRYLGGDGVIDEQLAPEMAPAPCIGREEGYAARTRAEDAPVEAERCLQCDLRLQIAPTKFWGEYKSAKKPAAGE